MTYSLVVILTAGVILVTHSIAAMEFSVINIGRAVIGIFLLQIFSFFRENSC